MALLEYIDIGNRFKDTESLFSAVETICTLNESTDLNLLIRTSDTDLVETVLKAGEESKKQISIHGDFPYQKEDAELWLSFLMKNQKTFHWTFQLKKKLSELNDPPHGFVFNQDLCAIELTTLEKESLKPFVLFLGTKFNIENLYAQLERKKTISFLNNRIEYGVGEKSYSLRLHGPLHYIRECIPFFISCIEPKKIEFLVNQPKKGLATLGQFIQTRKKGKFRIEAILNYEQLKKICLAYPDGTIEIRLPKGVIMNIGSKEIGIVGFWDDIYERRKNYEEKLGFIRDEDDLEGISS